jgi:L-lysine exporter family protein LysE/ArgO
VAGFGALTRLVPGLEWGMRLFGAAFLLWYGARSLRAAWRGGDALRAGVGAQSLRGALMTCLALTWLNPHVYLDTVVLLGAVAAQYDDRMGFASGAMTASFVFFFGLGYGARLLAPVFARPGAWRVLETCVGLVMWAIAVTLVMGG